MKIKTIALATVFALSSTFALAQSGNTAGGSSQAGGPAASKTTSGESKDGRTTQSQGGGATMKQGTTGPAAQSNMPSTKDSSTQGANTAGAADKKGDAASPGGTMKK
jgi:hypothetical protein